LGVRQNSLFIQHSLNVKSEKKRKPCFPSSDFAGFCPQSIHINRKQEEIPILCAGKKISCAGNPNFLRRKKNFLRRKSQFPAQEKKFPAQEISILCAGNTHLLVCFYKLHIFKRFLDTLSENKNNAGLFDTLGIH
jgi:hypothetical protein